MNPGPPSADPDPGRAAAQADARLAFAAAFYGGAALVASGLAWALGAPMPRLGLTPRALAEGALAALGLVLLSRQLRRIPAAARLEDALAPTFDGFRPWQVAAVGLISGASEEWIFRGLLMPWMGPVASSLLFGAVHVPPRRDLWFFPAFATGGGFVLAWLALRHGGVGASVVCHALVNAGNIAWMQRRRRLAGGQPSGPA